MKRRHFIKYSATGIVIPSLIHGFQFKALSASPVFNALQQKNTDTDRVLVMIQLGGGNDGLNTVIPLDAYDTLASLRPQVILPQNELLSLSAYENVGLHPAMTGMQQLFNDGKLKILQGVGYPNQNYSHFRSTDIWMSGANENEYLQTGWAGRYLHNEYPNFPYDYPNAQVTDPLAIEIGFSQSYVFQGPLTAMAVTLSDAESFYNLANGIQSPVPDTPAGEQLSYVRLIAQQSNAYGQVMINAYNGSDNSIAYPDENELAQQLRIVARMIAGGLKTRIYLVHLDGFDNHDTQVEYDNHSLGEHALLLSRLSEAIQIFQSDLEGLNIADRVMGMTFSEFGRRIISNDSRGTDHGAAAPLFMFGTAVEAGILGENPEIPAEADEDTNVAMQQDFRSIYATILRDWFCVPQEELLLTTLQDHPFLPLFSNIDCVPVIDHIQNQQAGTALLHCFPNPVLDVLHIEYTSMEGPLSIMAYDPQGHLLASIFNGFMPAGHHKQLWDMSHLPAGIYYLHYLQGADKQTKTIVKK